MLIHAVNQIFYIFRIVLKMEIIIILNLKIIVTILILYGENLYVDLKYRNNVQKLPVYMICFT